MKLPTSFFSFHQVRFPDLRAVNQLKTNLRPPFFSGKPYLPRLGLSFKLSIGVYLEFALTCDSLTFL
jgi:hypothetical protein